MNKSFIKTRIDELYKAHISTDNDSGADAIIVLMIIGSLVTFLVLLIIMGVRIYQLGYDNVPFMTYLNVLLYPIGFSLLTWTTLWGIWFIGGQLLNLMRVIAERVNNE